MVNKIHTVLVYGTLRPFTNTDVVYIPGQLYDLGWYPGIKLGGEGCVVCERITATEERLQQLDAYEGYHPNNPDRSLYLREKVGEDWIYVYHGYGRDNPFEGRTPIESGDWQQHTKKELESVVED
jgi:gamma-glutamylcyclotransferase (GGCT)/AIG2-like uncharacterized protein YtfP